MELVPRVLLDSMYTLWGLLSIVHLHDGAKRVLLPHPEEQLQAMSRDARVERVEESAKEREKG